MPRRRLLGTGGFHQRMVVIQAGFAALHQLTGRFGNTGFKDEFAVFGDVLPVAEVLEKPAFVVGFTGDFGARAGVFDVVINTGRQRGDGVGINQTAYYYHAVFGKFFN